MMSSNKSEANRLFPFRYTIFTARLYNIFLVFVLITHRSTVSKLATLRIISRNKMSLSLSLLLLFLSMTMFICIPIPCHTLRRSSRAYTLWMSLYTNFMFSILSSFFHDNRFLFAGFSFSKASMKRRQFSASMYMVFWPLKWPRLPICKA